MWDERKMGVTIDHRSRLDSREQLGRGEHTKTRPAATPPYPYSTAVHAWDHPMQPRSLRDMSRRDRGGGEISAAGGSYPECSRGGIAVFTILDMEIAPRRAHWGYLIRPPTFQAGRPRRPCVCNDRTENECERSNATIERQREGDSIKAQLQTSFAAR